MDNKVNYKSKQKTLIIAEAGVNHNGNIDLAFKLIDSAADAGADLIKFQTFKADNLASYKAKKASYQIDINDNDIGQREMLRKLELSFSDHEKLLVKCEERGIDFFSTGFDIESIDFLNDIGLSLFKIPSGELTNLPYIRRIGSYGKPVIISTGMAKIGEIETALNALEESGISREKITLLHCTTDYPTPYSDANLLVIKTLKKTFGVETGFSDHTLGIEISLAAAALGASVIEKHFTLDRTFSGPDHATSLEPNELEKMISCIRNIEVALGSPIKQPTRGEINNRSLVRKSIVAAQKINQGELFSELNLTTKRPGTGLSPMLWDELIGKRAWQSYEIDDEIKL